MPEYDFGALKDRVDVAEPKIHTSAMPDSGGANEDHDERYYTKDQIDARPCDSTVPVATATYELAASGVILHVTRTLTGTCAITIPTALIMAGVSFSVKDAGGNCNANNITLLTEGAETIDGAVSYTMNIDYMSLSLYSYGGNLFIY